MNEHLTPIPIYMLTGYLGSGKTTVLNHMLSLPELITGRTAVIVNEFGNLGVDGQLIREGDYAVIELNRGCLFCSCIKTDLIETVRSIVEDIQPDRVLVEASGVAETSDMQEVFAASGFTGQVELRANLCVVDGLNLSKVLPFLRAATTQIEWADGVILNKADLIDEEAQRRVLALVASPIEGINPGVACTVVTQGRVSWEFIDSLSHRSARPTHEINRPANVVTESFEIEHVDREAFYRAIDQLDQNLLRLKGHVDFGEGPLFVETVLGMRRETRLEKRPAQFGFAAIGWNVTEATLKNLFSKAIRER